jgi:hypothetical protein
LLVSDDTPRVNALLAALREREARAFDFRAARDDAAALMAADVILVDTRSQERLAPTLRTLSADVRARWAAQVRIDFASIVPGDGSVHMKTLMSLCAPPLAAEHELTERARRDTQLSVPLAPLGPTRLLRALAKAGPALHVRFRAAALEVEVELANELLVSAKAKIGNQRIDAWSALTKLLPLSVAQAQVERRPFPSGMNIMEPLGQALEVAAQEYMCGAEKQAHLAQENSLRASLPQSAEPLKPDASKAAPLPQNKATLVGAVAPRPSLPTAAKAFVAARPPRADVPEAPQAQERPAEPATVPLPQRSGKKTLLGFSVAQPPVPEAPVPAAPVQAAPVQTAPVSPLAQPAASAAVAGLAAPAALAPAAKQAAAPLEDLGEVEDLSSTVAYERPAARDPEPAEDPTLPPPKTVQAVATRPSPEVPKDVPSIVVDHAALRASVPDAMAPVDVSEVEGADDDEPAPPEPVRPVSAASRMAAESTLITARAEPPKNLAKAPSAAAAHAAPSGRPSSVRKLWPLAVAAVAALGFVAFTRGGEPGGDLAKAEPRAEQKASAELAQPPVTYEPAKPVAALPTQEKPVDAAPDAALAGPAQVADAAAPAAPVAPAPEAPPEAEEPAPALAPTPAVAPEPELAPVPSAGESAVAPEAAPRSIAALEHDGIQLLTEGTKAAAESARPIFEELVARDPQNPHGHAGLAQALLTLGELEPARRSALEAVKLRGKRSRYRVLLGDVLEAMNKPSEARAAWRRALELDPADPEAKLRARR